MRAALACERRSPVSLFTFVFVAVDECFDDYDE
jgi:hypothetical protein